VDEKLGQVEQNQAVTKTSQAEFSNITRNFNQDGKSPDDI
jgi:hypothetical protein